MYNITTIAE